MRILPTLLSAALIVCPSEMPANGDGSGAEASQSEGGQARRGESWEYVGGAGPEDNIDLDLTYLNITRDATTGVAYRVFVDEYQRDKYFLIEDTNGEDGFDRVVAFPTPATSGDVASPSVIYRRAGVKNIPQERIINREDDGFEEHYQRAKEVVDFLEAERFGPHRHNGVAIGCSSGFLCEGKDYGTSRDIIPYFGYRFNGSIGLHVHRSAHGALREAVFDIFGSIVNMGRGIKKSEQFREPEKKQFRLENKNGEECIVVFPPLGDIDGRPETLREGERFEELKRKARDVMDWIEKQEHQKNIQR